MASGASPSHTRGLVRTDQQEFSQIPTRSHAADRSQLEWSEPVREVHAFARSLFMYNPNNGEVSIKGYTQKKRPAGDRQRSACRHQNAARTD
jgi:hypothetical protein